MTDQEDSRVAFGSVPRPAEQGWFWTELWQMMEREVDQHVLAGRVTVVDGPDGLFAYLDGALGALTRPRECGSFTGAAHC